MFTPITDAHAHIYPDKIAEKAIENISGYYNIPAEQNGTVEGLLACGNAVGVTNYLVHSTATAPRQVTHINDYIAGEVAQHNAFTGFGTLHPAMTEQEVQAEIARMLSLGLKGVKLHPDFQAFYIDSEEAQTLYALLQEAKLPILFHVGDENTAYSQPERLAAVAKKYPQLTVIGAHFGGYSQWNAVEDVYHSLENVYYDTSSSLFKLAPEKAVHIIHSLGASHFFYGSDFPLWDHRTELNRFLALPLSENEQLQILHDNAKAVLGIG